ncbi:hypothetical protein ACRALDRAFT_2053850 [Sodiomyces alcalophilus JCM 7366]|uniref:uncharacterized protein n=1 Tax=Sodiomyces alcalophilus JCM 7366 TaxID=591952 RepID=UPI0039B6BE3B
MPRPQSIMALFRISVTPPPGLASSRSINFFVRSTTRRQPFSSQLKSRTHSLVSQLRQSRPYSVNSSKKPPTLTSLRTPPPSAAAQLSHSLTLAIPLPPVIPEQILIYHAGTTRIVFLAFWKITSIFVCAFFVLVAAPNYIRSEDKSYLQAAGRKLTSFVLIIIPLVSLLTHSAVAACGMIPLVYIAYTTGPFVSFIYLRLPPSARTSRQHLERFIRSGLPPSTQLQVLTMGLAGRPRTALVSLADFKPVTERWGLVNYARDVSRLSAARKWHQYRPVAKFAIRAPNAKDVREAWVWDTIRPLLGKTQRQRT